MGLGRSTPTPRTCVTHGQLGDEKICHKHVDHIVADPENAPLADSHVAMLPPEIPCRPPDPYAEVRNPAHSLGQTPETLPLVPEESAKRQLEEPAKKTPDTPATPVTPTVNPEQNCQGHRYPAKNCRPP